MSLLVIGGVVQPMALSAPTVEAAPPPAVAAPAGGTISGLVTDDRGAPLGGVTVQSFGVFSQTTQTGPDGRYLFSGLSNGSYRLAVDSSVVQTPTFSPFVPYPSLVNVSSVVGQAGVDFELQRPAIVTGTVRDQAGVPVPNAQIGGIANIFPPGVVTGPDGQYLATVPPGPRTISASAVGFVGGFGPGDPGGATATTINAVAGQATRTDFVLDAGGAISGQVQRTTGEPVVSAFVSATTFDAASGHAYGGSAVTDATGTYVMRGLIPGDYIVSSAITTTSSLPVLYFPGTPDVNAAIPVTVADGATTPSIDLDLPVVTQGPPITATAISPATFTRGTTVTATITGTGFVPGELVGIESFGQPPRPDMSVIAVVDSTRVLVTVTTPLDAALGADGGFFMGQLGQFTECFCGPLVVDGTVAFGTISGRVTRASDGTPLANVRVGASTGGSAAPLGGGTAALSAADGTYQIGPLPVGDYVVRFSPGFGSNGLLGEFYADAKTESAITPVSVTADSDTPNIDAAIDPRVVSPVIASASPSVLMPGTTTDVTLTGSGFGIDDSFSVSAGNFGQPFPRVVATHIVSSTELVLSVQIDSLTPSAAGNITVFPGGSGLGSTCNCLSIGAPPESTGTASGAVTDPLGNGLGNIHVTALADGQTQPTSSAWTGADGTYALRLPAGGYTLHFEDLAGAAADLPGVLATVGAFSAGVDATITPLASIGALSGTVSDPSTLTLHGPLVEVTNLDTGATSAMLTNAFGAYRFSTLDAGTYIVQFSGVGYQTRWYNGAVDAASATPVTVTGAAETVAIDGVIPPSRRALSVRSVTPARVAVGETLQATILGSGFAFGDVTNLSFSAGAGVTIAVIDPSPDSSATVSIAVDPSAPLGTHDIVATRDDGQQSTCAACLRVLAAVGSISGSMVTANGFGLFFPNITATSVTTGEVFTTQPGLAGAYQFDRLPADDYVVQFVSPGFATQWYDNAASAAAATPVTVGAAPVSGINATMQPGRRQLSINGMGPSQLQQGKTTNVTIFGAGFLDGGVTNLSFDAGAGITVAVTGVTSDFQATASIAVAPDAALGLHVLTATRDDATTASCFFCLLVIVPTASISGHVTAFGGTTVPLASVSLFAIGQPFPLTTVGVQFDGTYTFDNVAPGAYNVQFNSQFDPEWWDNAPTQAAATNISVAAGQSITGIDADLSVASAPLRLDPGFPTYEAFQGTSHSLTVFGSGFLTGVTGLTFSAGPGISITTDTVFSDTFANITITADPTADLGLRDLVVSRDDGQTSTCALCLNVVPQPPGQIFGSAIDADTGGSVFGSVTVTRVGDVTPTQSQFFFSSFFLFGIPAGDYDVSIDAGGYLPFTSRVTVIAGQATFVNAQLLTTRQALTYAAPPALTAYQGFATHYVVFGSGFRSGGVTGLSFSAGPDVAVTIDPGYADTVAQITLTTAATAEPGTRDLTVTRDDGQVAVCTGCVTVSPPAPGSISGVVYASDTFSFVDATVTLTLVGDTTPTASISAFGPFSIPDIAPGDYDVLFESPGLISTTQRVTVQPATDSGAVAFLDLPRQPLSVTSVSPNVLNASSSFESLEVHGSGFRAGGVTGLTATIGPDGIVQFVSVLSDSTAIVFVFVPQTATLGTFDVVLSRDPGESTTCTGCVTVREAPAFILGFVSDAECCGAVSATVTATRVGDTVPTASESVVGFYQLQVPAGDYIVKAEAAGYITQWWDHVPSESAATAVSVAAGAFQSNVDFALTPVPNALTLDGVAIDGVAQGQSQSVIVIGNGFSRGGVSGLTFTAGTGVTITVDALFSDSVALTTISVADDAKVGARNVTASRDDGSVATCVGCLVVLRGQPVVTAVNPAIVREGKRTITVSGEHLQRVTKVRSSSRQVVVQSFKNKADGSIAVQVKIDGGARKTYTLTFTRDDGTTFTADFSVGK